MKTSARPGGFRLILANKAAAWGFYALSAVVLVALAAPLLPLADPDATAPAKRLLPPFSEGHWLGTDSLGRDLLSRLIWGARVSLAVGVAATCVAAFFGSLIGLLAGYFGGRADTVLMRIVDMIMAFPYILLALLIVAVLGPGLLNALYAIAVVNIPFFARNIRGAALGLSRREFVDAARLAGKSHAQILMGEVLPNVAPIIAVTMSATIGWMILETAGLSFLGLGAQPPQADLGSMLGEGRKLLFTAPHVSIIPGLAIFALVMGVNLFGDGVRDAMDPRLKSGEFIRPAARTTVTRDVAGEPSRTGALLEAKDIRAEFRMGGESYRAADGVGFYLQRGECLGVVGESGCGKSATALALMGLLPSPPGRITGGAAFLRGEDLFAADGERLRQLRGGAVGYVFQDALSSLHPLATVGEQMCEAMQAHRRMPLSEARKHAQQLLGAVRIPNPAARMRAYPHELSGGMRQRICIAMALAGGADVIVADEPTTALDVSVQARVLALLNELRASRGAAVLFISHDFGVVSAVCDRVAVMYAGKIVESGKTREVLNAPAHPYTAALLQCLPGGGNRKPRAIEGAPPPMNDLPRGCAFAPRCSRARDECRSEFVGNADIGGERTVRCLFPLAAQA